jgi:SAM-dependent methyltransferase
VPPVRRELRADREISYDELWTMVPWSDARYLSGILIRPAGADAFSWLADGQAARPGDELMLYTIDKQDVDQLVALNLEFDRGYYPRQSGIRPDERELIEARLPPGDGRILEICCGAGRITTHLVRDGNRVVGIDINRHCVEVARARDGDRPRYLVGDATRLPFADGSFDIGCCLENALGVLFSRAPTAVAELIRVTRPGGRVLLGFREQGGRADRFHMYQTANGHLSVAQTFDAASVDQLMAALPVAATARIAAREPFAGAARPWGGTTFYLQLNLAAAAPA